MELKLTERSRRSQRTEGVQNKSGKNKEGVEEGARKDFEKRAVRPFEGVRG